jgi:signal transduction histidine kinase/CheY-like chemotaxis protein
MRELSDGTILLTLNSGIRLLRNNNGVYQLEAIPGAEDIEKTTITQSFEDTNGRIYLSANADELRIYDRIGLGIRLSATHPGMGYVWDFHQRPASDTIWMTSSSGLVTLHTTTEKISTLNPDQGGLENETFYDLLEDDEGLFWLTSNNGIVRFNPQNGAWRRFTQVDGVQDYKFYPYAALKTSGGAFWFGGVRGVNMFNPNTLTQVPTLPKVQLTEILVNNDPLVGEQAVGELQALDFDYNENTLAFRFAALEYSDPQNNQLEYRMINQDPDNQWVKADSRGKARYANLRPGQYTFEVRAANSDGVLNEEPARLSIFIRKPFWETAWFRGLVLLAIVGVVITVARFILRRRLAEAEALRLKELDEFKNRLYQNITHEFRTPLTVIMGMTDQIMGNEQSKDLIRRNSKNMLSLINQILDLSRLESGRMDLEWIQLNIVDFIHYLTESFQPLADQKDLKLIAYCEEEALWMDTDQEKFQQVVTNLISNAVKFTNPGGKVVLHASLQTEEESRFLQMVVKDTGIGIPAAQLPHIFDRFYQTSDQEKKDRKVKGSGVGLTLSKELIELMGGTIEASSEEGKGTTFKVNLPITNQAPKGEIDKPEEIPAEAETPAAVAAPLRPTDVDAPLALLVDDNEDITTYIQSCIQGHYRIATAGNGQLGIDKALEIIPDIIISDVMMPEKDGFELCDALKNDPRTSHIPIILLTARSNAKDRVTGLQKGADAYLTKPFHKEELMVRLDKLVEMRRQLQERYSGLEAISANPNPTPEEEFLQALQAVVQDRLGDIDLGVVDLCRAVHLSHTQVYRKLKALTGKTPSQFIRTIRLQKGLQLLKTTNEPVSAIAYDVGFSDPNYFSRVFQEEYGQTPSSVRG